MILALHRAWRIHSTRCADGWAVRAVLEVWPSQGQSTQVIGRGPTQMEAAEACLALLSTVRPRPSPELRGELRWRVVMTLNLFPETNP